MMPGPLVSMVGEGDRLLLVTHSGHPLPLPGHQALAYSLYTVSLAGVSPAHSATPTLPLPLTPGMTSTWKLVV